VPVLTKYIDTEKKNIQTSGLINKKSMDISKFPSLTQNTVNYSSI